jgi:hypothetical protein
MRCAGRGRHSQCAQLEAPSPLYSARGTVSLYVQLSALMHSYVGFGLAVHAVCWTRPPLTFICLGVCSAGGTVSFVLSSRHHQPVCAAVGPNAQLCRLWACSACGVLDVAAAYTLYASQCAQLEAPSAVRAAVGSKVQLHRLWACCACGALDVAAAYSSYPSQRTQLERHRQLVCAAVGSNAQRRRLWACSACGVLDVAAASTSYASQCAQLEAPSACTCSCRFQCTATQALGLQCMQCA